MEVIQQLTGQLNYLKCKKNFSIHRREKLRPRQKCRILKSLEKNVEFVIPFQLDSINGKDGIINELVVKDLTII